MCEDEGTKGGNATVEAARCGIRREGNKWVVPVDYKVREGDEKDAREISPQPGRSLRGSMETGRKETGAKKTGRKETGWKEMGVMRREPRKQEGRRRERGRREGRRGRWEGRRQE